MPQLLCNRRLRSGNCSPGNRGELVGSELSEAGCSDGDQGWKVTNGTVRAPTSGENVTGMKLTTRILATAAAVALLFLVGSVSAPAAAAPQTAETAASAADDERTSGPIRNANSGKCLTVRGTAEGAPAVQYSCTNLRDQLWSFPRVGHPGQIRNLHSNKCLVARGPANNAPVVQTQCAHFADQQWYIAWWPATNRFHFENKNSGKCLLVRGHAQNAQVVQFQCAAYADQRWF